ncbi:MAG TPA: tetratricopeptide repeat protein [Methylomirabilota bacterium]|nr:tetratricopeptide repeat protein [Methylomirabilota bacterium]
MTAPGWVLTERDVVRLLALNPRRTEQLRRLQLLHASDRPDQYTFRDLVALRVARTLLDQGATVRQIRRALDTLRRLAPGSETPFAELRVTVRDGEIFIERDARLLEPSGQIVMEFSEKGLAEDARASVLRGLVRPLALPGGEAERWFELASELDGDPAQWAQAVEAYQRVTTLAPGHGAAWNNLGLLQHRMGRYEDARRHYEMALEADPTLAEAAYNLGSLHDDLGTPPRAALWYRRALEIRPDYADAHFNLASALERAGDGSAARRHWLRYLDLDPDSRWAEIARGWVSGEGR